MKKSKCQVLFSILMGFVLNTVSEAQPVLFGNSPNDETGFTMYAQSAANGSGGAVAFTPLQDLTFGSITVWLTGYTGLDLYGQMNQSFYAGIYTDNSEYLGSPGFGTAENQPFQQILSLNVPSPNDGSLAGFNFSNPFPEITLHADTTYWLFIYENTGGSLNINNPPHWVGGGDFAGNAVYNGSDSFAFPVGFTPSSVIPAFAINPVPEPGVTALIAVSFLCFCAWRCQWRKAGQ